MQFIPTNTQVNDAINQMSAFVEGVLPQKETPAPYGFAKVASTTSQKMMKAQSRDDHSVSSSSAEDTESSTNVSEEDREESECTTYDWDDVMEQIKYNPSLAKVDVDGILPLHAACGAGAPIDTIKLLIDMYPAAAQAKCGKGYLPIFYHLALITESPSEDVVSTLLEAYPGAAAVVDPDNQLPIHLACKAKGVSEKIFTKLLEDYPNGAYERDNKGKFPVDYATKNSDEATKEVALGALLTNDPEEFKKRYVDVVPKMYAQEEIEVSLKPAQTTTVKLTRSNGSAVSQASSKTSSVESTILTVSRSRSNISVKSQSSKKSPEEVDDDVAEVPMARSRSNVSVKSQLSKKSCKSVEEEEEEEEEEVEEEVADVPVARSRSNFSIKSFASKKSLKPVEEDAAEVPVARSRSNFSIRSLVSRKSCKVDEEEDVIEEDEAAEDEEKEVVAEIPVARSRSNVSVKCHVSTKSAKPVEEDVAEIPVARSQSNVSVKSVASKKSVKSVVEVPVSRSPSNVSIKSQLSKKSTKAVEEVEKEEQTESSASGETTEVPDVPAEEIVVVSDEKVEEAVEKPVDEAARPRQLALKSFKSVSFKAKGFMSKKWKRN